MAHRFERELAENRVLWDAWTAVNTGSAFYDVARFRDDPRDVRIEPWERAEVGDVAGKSLLHVQCHFGLDTLSWARLGAARVTGVDWSEPAVAFATRLAAAVGLAERARFLQANVYDLPGPIAGETFDVVYTGRGALGWLPDLAPWARMVASFLKPGGIFYVHEAHPIMWTLDDDQPPSDTVRLRYDYWNGDVITTPVVGSYADPTATVASTVQHGWNHPLGEVVSLLAREGLRIELLDEKRELPWPMPWLVEKGGGNFGWPEGQTGTLPLAYSLRARKEA